MKRKLVIGAGAALLLVASFVAGRFSAPVSKTQVDQTAWLAEFLSKLETTQTTTTKKHVETRKEKKPDGTITIVRIEDSGSNTDTHSTGTIAGRETGSASSTATTTSARPGWAAGVAATWNPKMLSATPDRLSLEVDRRLIGTIWLGARASTDLHLDAPQLGVAVRMEW